MRLYTCNIDICLINVFIYAYIVHVHKKMYLLIITLYEIIGGLKYKNAEKQLNEFEQFALNNTIIHISENSAKISGSIYAMLRQDGITIGTSDILIAGIAIENDLTLITNNLKHYEPIKNLSIENWKS